MKKQFHALALSAALLVSPLTQAADCFSHQCGATGLGGTMIATGLYLISKSGGKKGNTAKGLLGLIMTLGGGYVMLKGPGYVRYKKDGTIRTFDYLGISNKAEQATVKKMKKFADQKAKAEKNSIKQFGYNAIAGLLTYLPSDAVPIPDHLKNK